MTNVGSKPIRMQKQPIFRNYIIKKYGANLMKRGLPVDWDLCPKRKQKSVSKQKNRFKWKNIRQVSFQDLAISLRRNRLLKVEVQIEFDLCLTTNRRGKRDLNGSSAGKSRLTQDGWCQD